MRRKCLSLKSIDQLVLMLVVLQGALENIGRAGAFWQTSAALR